MKASRFFKVTYDKANNTEGFLVVKASDEENALGNAKANCFTGRNFRNAIEVEEQATFSQKHPNGRGGTTCAWCGMKTKKLR